MKAQSSASIAWPEGGVGRGSGGGQEGVRRRSGQEGVRRRSGQEGAWRGLGGDLSVKSRRP
eukprot:880880-Prorocentrum_minimum.AAC.1